MRTLALAAALAIAGCTATTTQRVPAVNAQGGLGVAGYDPVSYFTDAGPTEGALDHRRTWEGVTYAFATPENAERFERDPERYLPAYGGYCAYAMSTNRIAEIDPERWEVRDGRLFLNANLLAEVLWEIDRDGNTRAADAHWAEYPRGAIPVEDAPGGSAASPPPGTPGDARGRGADLSLSHQG